MKKVSSVIVSILLTVSLPSCGVNRISEIQNNEKAVPAFLTMNKPSIPVKSLKTGFSVKSVNGDLNTSGQTYASGDYNYSNYIFGYNFEYNKVYKIKIKADSLIYGFMWKYRKGNWEADRWITSNDEILFRGGYIDFEAIYVGAFAPPTCPSPVIKFTAEIKEVVEKPLSTNPLKVSYQSQKVIFADKTMSYSSCAPVSAAMLVDYHNRKKTGSIKEEAAKIYGNIEDIRGRGAIVNEGTRHGDLENVLKNKYGFTVDYIDGKDQKGKEQIWNSIVSEINSGRPAIFRSHGFLYVDGQVKKHYILVIGYNSSKKTVITNDPWYGQGYVHNFNEIVSNTPGLITAR